MPSVSSFVECGRSLYYLIVDEGQAWYPLNANEKARKELDDFWAEVKYFLNPGQDWSTYITARSAAASKSVAASISKIEVRLLCVAAYGEVSLGSVSTPHCFVDPMAWAGFPSLRLREDLWAYQNVTPKSRSRRARWHPFQLILQCATWFSSRRMVTSEPFVLFSSTSSARARQPRIHLFSHVSNWTDRLSSFLICQWTHVPAIDVQGHLLLRSLAFYKQGNHAIPADAEADGLIKPGTFVKAVLTTLAFPSPLHFDLALDNVVHNNHNLIVSQKRLASASAFRLMTQTL